MPTILVINPNTSASVTSGLQDTFAGIIPPDLKLSLKFGNPPPGPDSPKSINNPIDSVLSAAASWKYLTDEGLLDEPSIIGIIVCCFSDHPLTHMLRHYYETKPESHRKTVTNILEASVNYCISLRKPFGILTTGAYWQKPLTDATNAVMGDQNNTEFVGVVCSGLGVVDVGSTGENEATLQHSAVELTQKGATVIILGCAGMTGMEKIINTGLYNAGISPVDVVDGTWAGLQMFTDMARKKS